MPALNTNTKALPSPLTMKLIARGVAVGAFSWPETAAMKWARIMQKLQADAAEAVPVGDEEVPA